ncbi:hypothetical protein [Neobacillus sp. Marseille-QA0830]
MQLEGNLISGEFDESMNEFSLKSFKHFYTESTINSAQFTRLYSYLTKHASDPEGQIITLYDQIPIKLSQAETQLLLGDLKKIQSMYH